MLRGSRILVRLIAVVGLPDLGKPGLGLELKEADARQYAV
jgi:hypothetical protein